MSETFIDSDTLLYPPENRFVVYFETSHLLTTGQWSPFYRERRFYLAKSAEQAKQAALAEIAVWGSNFHRIQNLRVVHCPDAVAYTLGYYRFGGMSNLLKNSLQDSI